MLADELQTKLDRYYAHDGDTFVRYTHRRRVEHITRRIGGAAAGHADRHPQDLDAGTRYGIYALIVARSLPHGYEVTSVDLNEEQIHTAKEWFRAERLQGKITLQVEDLERLPSDWSSRLRPEVPLRGRVGNFWHKDCTFAAR